LIDGFEQLASAAEIVRRSLTAEDAQGFLRGSEAEKSAYFLRAAMAMPVPTGICTKFALYMVDLDDSSGTDVGVGQQYMKMLGSDNPAQWSELDTKGRCTLIAKGREVVTRLALSIVRDGSMDQVAGVAKRLGVDTQTPHYAVIDMFGAASGEKYNALTSVDEKLQLYKAALLMQLSWSAVYLAL